ncbi:hypothetical protein ESA94_02820 [Lacibacter luteus]|uniref:DUF1080 domain-containing protein n=1 Tax=Lacibacter luteus TaxID=2508719 RepID=A0A4Q1CLS4_9BACT|nr:hypothetical protein [Lacibacter luteus]RXK61963.1 hypothetical protein ESA94_02820 [Lacibacter luteus]
MKLFSLFIALLSAITGAAQADSTSANIIFFDGFDNNANNWTVADDKNVRSKIEGGVYYLTATGHAYGEAHEIKIDTRKDFQIEASIKIVSGNAEHKNYFSMLFWGREAMQSHYFTFAKDGFASVQFCTGKTLSSCTVKKGSLQKTMLNPDDFNVYRIKKTGNTYTFSINDDDIYTMPFTPFFGNLIGFGAGRKISLAIDYLKVIYL